MISVMQCQKMYCPYMGNKCKNEACMFWHVSKSRVNWGVCLLVEDYKDNIPVEVVVEKSTVVEPTAEQTPVETPTVEVPVVEKKEAGFNFNFDESR